jgi:hypothetical protein
MKKRITIIASAAFLCISMTAVLFCGCGSGGMATIENPLDFFGQARENMQTAASYRMSGEMLIDYSGSIEMTNMAIDYDMFFEQKTDGETLIKMVMAFDMPGSESDSSGPSQFNTEAYVTGDRMYMKMPWGAWVYQDYDLSSSLTEMSQGIGPQYVSEILDMAESAEVVTEDADSITYRLVLDFDKMMKEVDLETVRERLDSLDVTEEDLTAYMEMVKDLLSEMDFEMTVDKGSGMVRDFYYSLEMDLGKFSMLFQNDPALRGAKIDMEGVFTIGDYGKAFNLELPRETEDAIPMDEMEQLSEV